MTTIFVSATTNIFEQLLSLLKILNIPPQNVSRWSQQQYINLYRLQWSSMFTFSLQMKHKLNVWKCEGMFRFSCNENVISFFSKLKRHK